MISRNQLSVVIPVYNSETIMPHLVARLESVLDACADEYEVILVNDGSKDESWKMIITLVNEHEWVRGIDLMRNYGQHNALLCGIRAAQYEIIITMDDDLQHPPEEISNLLEKLNEGYEVVYGRPKNEQHGVWRDLASQLTKFALQGTLGIEAARSVSAFRAIRSYVRDAFAHYEGPYVALDVLLTWGTNKFCSIPVQHDPRSMGKSNYTFRKLVAHAVNLITGFSVLPLRIASLVGFTFTFFGLAAFVYIIGRYLIQGSAVPGFPFLASTIAIFSGAQLFAIGIIGEYLARMYFRSMGRPYSVIRTTVGSPNENEDNWS